MRSITEIEAMRNKAQDISFRLEDDGDDNSVEEALYQALNWVLGESDQNPIDYMAELPEDDDDPEDDRGKTSKVRALAMPHQERKE